jgi:hypothetical protein
MYLMSVWRRGEYGRINGGTLRLKLLEDNWEAAPWHGARSTSTSAPKTEPTKDGGELNTFSEDDSRGGWSGMV